jgi:hypothetical protein
MKNILLLTMLFSGVAFAQWPTQTGTGDGLPSQTGNDGKYLQTNGAAALWIDLSGSYVSSGSLSDSLTTLRDEAIKGVFVAGNYVVAVDTDSIVTIPIFFEIDLDSTLINEANLNVTWFRPSVAFLVDSMVTVSYGTANWTPKVFWGVSRASGTALITSPSATTSTTTGDVVTSFNNGTITKNAYVWVERAGATTVPHSTHIIIYGRYSF